MRLASVLPGPDQTRIDLKLERSGSARPRCVVDRLASVALGLPPEGRGVGAYERRFQEGAQCRESVLPANGVVAEVDHRMGCSSFLRAVAVVVSGSVRREANEVPSRDVAEEGLLLLPRAHVSSTLSNLPE